MRRGEEGMGRGGRGAGEEGEGLVRRERGCGEEGEGLW